MHVGNYLKNILKEERYSMSQIADKVNKSPAGVKKDLEKDKLSMAVLESYAEVLEINLYELLAKDWSEQHNLPDPIFTVSAEPTNPSYAKKAVSKADDEISVTINLRGKKKESILKILFEE